jgi:hypothetical protein
MVLGQHLKLSTREKAFIDRSEGEVINGFSRGGNFTYTVIVFGYIQCLLICVCGGGFSPLADFCFIFLKFANNVDFVLFANVQQLPDLFEYVSL